MIPIVDTHQHLWDLQRFRLPWTDGAPSLARNFLMEDYQRATQGLGIAQSVYMEVDVAAEQQVAEAEWIFGQCAAGSGKLVAAVISGRPASAGFRAYVDRFRDVPYFKGVRQVLHGPSTPAGYCLSPEFVEGIRYLGSHGLRFDLCLRPGELGDGVKLIDACPETRFVLDHCGNANVQEGDLSEWRRQIDAIAGRRNVVAKVSGIVASAKPGEWGAEDLAPIVNHVWDAFGNDRVMFGGDWPVCTLASSYGQWVEALRKIAADRDELAQRKLWGENAVAFYGLKRLD
jgi:predicted TIM-barrel fold metal-dependent hydrolase